MYGLYSKAVIENQVQYKFEEEISIFGCNNGYIPWLLSYKLKKGDNEPLKWHINIESELNNSTEEYYHNTSIIIDIKPKNKNETYLTMAELTDVWGYSDSSWTPMLFRLNMLFTDHDINLADKKLFKIENGIEPEIVYSIIYARGSIKDGKIAGRWTPPSMSPTNSTLLWPETLKYFYDQIKSQDTWIL